MSVASFETKTLSLSAPVNLSLDADVAVDRLEDAVWIAIQNTGSSRVYWRETTTAPDAADRSHFMESGAGLIALVIFGRPFWLWSAEGDGEVTLTPAVAQPVRKA